MHLRRLETERLNLSEPFLEHFLGYRNDHLGMPISMLFLRFSLYHRVFRSRFLTCPVLCQFRSFGLRKAMVESLSTITHCSPACRRLAPASWGPASAAAAAPAPAPSARAAPRTQYSSFDSAEALRNVRNTLESPAVVWGVWSRLPSASGTGGARVGGPGRWPRRGPGIGPSPRRRWERGRRARPRRRARSSGAGRPARPDTAPARSTHCTTPRQRKPSSLHRTARSCSCSRRRRPRATAAAAPPRAPAAPAHRPDFAPVYYTRQSPKRLVLPTILTKVLFSFMHAKVTRI